MYIVYIYNTTYSYSITLHLYIYIIFYDRIYFSILNVLKIYQCTGMYIFSGFFLIVCDYDLNGGVSRVFYFIFF